MTEPPLIESERRALRDLLQLATDRAQAETEMEEQLSFGQILLQAIGI